LLTWFVDSFVTTTVAFRTALPGGVEDIAADGSGAALLRCRQKGQHHEDGEANAKLDEDTKTSNWTRFHGSSAWKWI
jgi:hypothetical protein